MATSEAISGAISTLLGPNSECASVSPLQLPIPICLVVMMGLPASGKSTLAQTIVQDVEKKKNGQIAISIEFDAFVPHEIQAKIVSLIYPPTPSQDQAQDYEKSGSLTRICRKKFIQCVKHVVLCLSESESRIQPDFEEDTLFLEHTPELEEILPNIHFERKTREVIGKLRMVKFSSVLLIIDDNHYYSSMRNEWFNLARTYRLGFCILYVKTSVTVCKNRNSIRQEQFSVPDRSIVDMSLKLEAPNPLGNAGDAYSLQIIGDLEDVNVTLVLNVLDNALKNPVEWERTLDRSEEVERERRICSQNEIHQADQILRKWVNKEVTMASISIFKDKSNVKSKGEFCKELNRKRILVLEQLKSGQVQIIAKVDQDIQFREEVIELVVNLRLDK